MAFDIPFVPPSGVEQIWYGVIAAVLAGACAALRRPLYRFAVPLLRRVGRRLPTRMGTRAREAFDLLSPSWRQLAGEERRTLQWRLDEMRSANRPAFAIVGGIYLDIRLRPVDVADLREGEFSVLDSITPEIGGSAFWVGRKLAELYDRRSYVFTRLGDLSDPLTAELKRLLKGQQWVKKLIQEPDTSSQSAISINLEGSNYAATTTLTHRGALGSLGWKQIHSRLHMYTKRGGIIYISAYFRTNLDLDLRSSLEALPPKTIVCLDHGRFQKSDFTRAGNALIEAFRARLIDVYLCTFDELRDFVNHSCQVQLDGSDVVEMLRIGSRQRVLPPVTVVRGELAASEPVAHVAIGERIRRVEHPGARLLARRVGVSNAFNAGFVDALATGIPTAPVESTVFIAAHAALSAWASSSQEVASSRISLPEQISVE